MARRALWTRSRSRRCCVMRQAAADACGFVAGLAKEDWLDDRPSQRAVIMSFIINGEAVRRWVDGEAEFARHTGVPWRNGRGLRNRLAQGCVDSNLDGV